MLKHNINPRVSETIDHVFAAGTTLDETRDEIKKLIASIEQKSYRKPLNSKQKQFLYGVAFGAISVILLYVLLEVLNK